MIKLLLNPIKAVRDRRKLRQALPIATGMVQAAILRQSAHEACDVDFNEIASDAFALLDVMKKVSGASSKKVNPTDPNWYNMAVAELKREGVSKNEKS